MKFFITICCMVASLQIQAQVTIADTVIHKQVNNIALNIVYKSNPTVASKNNVSIIYIKAVNDSFNEALAAFVATNDIVNSIVVDVTINDDTVINKSHIVTIDSLLSAVLVPIVNQQQADPSTPPFILIGLNDMVSVVMLQAAQHPTLFNKNIGWLNSPSICSIFTENDISLLKQLKGKLFVYNALAPKASANINSDIDFIALHAKVVIYKINGYVKHFSQMQLLYESKNWLLANGNNYIIKPLVTF